MGRGCAEATSLSQINVRVVCLCVPVFIIGPTVPVRVGNDICSDNLSCLLARSNSCHGLWALTAGQTHLIQFPRSAFHHSGQTQNRSKHKGASTHQTDLRKLQFSNSKLGHFYWGHTMQLNKKFIESVVILNGTHFEIGMIRKNPNI